MLNLNNNQIEADNRIVINGVEIGKLNDTDAQKVIDIIRGMMSSTAPSPKPVVATTKTLHIEDDVTPKKPFVVPGKQIYSETFVTVTNIDKEYRVYIHCPLGGEKGKKVRYAIKASAKEYGAKCNPIYGDTKDLADLYWIFPSKKQADLFVKARKEYTSK